MDVKQVKITQLPTTEKLKDMYALVAEKSGGNYKIDLGVVENVKKSVSDHVKDTTAHITSEERTAWNTEKKINWGDLLGDISNQTDLTALLDKLAPKPTYVLTTETNIALLPNQNVAREIASIPTVVINGATFLNNDEATFTQTGAYDAVISVTGLTLMYVGAWASVTPAVNRDMIYMFKRMGTKLYVTRNISSTTKL